MFSLHKGDCYEYMKTLPDGFFDLLLTDPPYGIGASAKNFKSGSLVNQRPDDFYGEWDKERPSKEVFEQMFRVSKNQIIFGGNYFIDYLTPTRCMIFWDKNTENTSYADGEIAWTSFDENTKLFRKSWVGANAKDTPERVHPTQKPVSLMKRIILHYTKPDETVFDPFMGSGAAGVACVQEGRNFYGCEINQRYFSIAKKRIEQAVLSPSLFTPANTASSGRLDSSAQQALFSAGEVLPAKARGATRRR